MTLRFELKEKFKSPVSDPEYKELSNILKLAKEKSKKHHVFWDLDRNESRRKTKRKLQYVAEKEGLRLKVVSLRNQDSLRLTFPEDTGKPPSKRKRLSAEEAREQILAALAKAKTPLSRQEILEITEVNASSWNLRVLELLGKRKIQKVGSGRATRYVSDKKQLEIPIK
jgi:hypothetical protein